MFFAAKDTVERWSRARDEKAFAKGWEQGFVQGWKQGMEAGRKEGRQEIVALLKEHDVPLPPEVLNRLNGDGE